MYDQVCPTLRTVNARIVLQTPDWQRRRGDFDLGLRGLGQEGENYGSPTFARMQGTDGAGPRVLHFTSHLFLCAVSGQGASAASLYRGLSNWNRDLGLRSPQYSIGKYLGPYMIVCSTGRRRVCLSYT